jgi:undecaprenyl-diphosphatase
MMIEKTMRERRYSDAAAIPLRIALMIGVAQCLSMIPGTSRSAATIMGALLLGLTHAAAAEFSFFLAIPTMFAAGGYSLLKHIDEIEPHQYGLLGLGFAVSFVVALLVVAAFMRFIQTHRFTSFAIYRIMLGALVLWALRNGFLES